MTRGDRDRARRDTNSGEIMRPDTNTHTELSDILGDLSVDSAETGEKGAGVGYDDGYNSQESSSEETVLEPLSISEEREEQCVVLVLYLAKGLEDQRFSPYERRAPACPGSVRRVLPVVRVQRQGQPQPAKLGVHHHTLWGGVHVVDTQLGSPQVVLGWQPVTVTGLMPIAQV